MRSDSSGIKNLYSGDRDSSEKSLVDRVQDDSNDFDPHCSSSIIFSRR